MNYAFLLNMYLTAAHVDCEDPCNKLCELDALRCTSGSYMKNGVCHGYIFVGPRSDEVFCYHTKGTSKECPDSGNPVMFWDVPQLIARVKADPSLTLSGEKGATQIPPDPLKADPSAQKNREPENKVDSTMFPSFETGLDATSFGVLSASELNGNTTCTNLTLRGSTSSESFPAGSREESRNISHSFSHIETIVEKPGGSSEITESMYVPTENLNCLTIRSSAETSREGNQLQDFILTTGPQIRNLKSTSSVHSPNQSKDRINVERRAVSFSPLSANPVGISPIEERVDRDAAKDRGFDTSSGVELNIGLGPFSEISPGEVSDEAGYKFHLTQGLDPRLRYPFIHPVTDDGSACSAEIPIESYDGSEMTLEDHSDSDPTRASIAALSNRSSRATSSDDSLSGIGDIDSEFTGTEISYDSPTGFRLLLPETEFLDPYSQLTGIDAETETDNEFEDDDLESLSSHIESDDDISLDADDDTSAESEMPETEFDDFDFEVYGRDDDEVPDDSLSSQLDPDDDISLDIDVETAADDLSFDVYGTDGEEEPNDELADEYNSSLASFIDSEFHTDDSFGFDSDNDSAPEEVCSDSDFDDSELMSLDTDSQDDWGEYRSGSQPSSPRLIRFSGPIQLQKTNSIRRAEYLHLNSTELAVSGFDPMLVAEYDAHPAGSADFDDIYIDGNTTYDETNLTGDDSTDSDWQSDRGTVTDEDSDGFDSVLSGPDEVDDAHEFQLYDIYVQGTSDTELLGSETNPQRFIRDDSKDISKFSYDPSISSDEFGFDEIYNDSLSGEDSIRSSDMKRGKPVNSADFQMCDIYNNSTDFSEPSSFDSSFAGETELELDNDIYESGESGDDAQYFDAETAHEQLSDFDVVAFNESFLESQSDENSDDLEGIQSEVPVDGPDLQLYDIYLAPTNYSFEPPSSHYSSSAEASDFGFSDIYGSGDGGEEPEFMGSDPSDDSESDFALDQIYPESITIDDRLLGMDSPQQDEVLFPEEQNPHDIESDFDADEQHPDFEDIYEGPEGVETPSGFTRDVDMSFEYIYPESPDAQEFTGTARRFVPAGRAAQPLHYSESRTGTVDESDRDDMIGEETSNLGQEDSEDDGTSIYSRSTVSSVGNPGRPPKLRGGGQVSGAEEISAFSA